MRFVPTKRFWRPTLDESKVLRVEGLSVDYGGGAVVRDVDLDTARGEIVTLLGANGSGRSSVLKALMGTAPAKGTIELDGGSIVRLSPQQRARRGMFLIPEDRGVFPGLTVAQHLRLAARNDRSAGDIDRAIEAFPQLASRMRTPAGALSGGEARMLLLAQAVLRRPHLLLIDELSFGLAPAVVSFLLELCRRLADEEHTAIVLVEQFVKLALDVADRAVVMSAGRATLSAPAADLRGKGDILAEAYLGRTGRAS